MPIPTVRKMRFRGSTVWEVDARNLKAECQARGIPVRRKFGTKAEADAWAARVVERVAAEPADRIEVQYLCDLFLESRGRTVAHDTLKGYRTALRRLNRFCDTSGIRYTDQLTRGVIGDYRDHLRSGKHAVSERTAGQYVAVAGVCFSWAVERDYADFNPFAGKANRSRRTTRRTLTDDEREAIVTDAEHRDLWRFMLSTGLRVVEVCRLEHEDVRLDTPSPHLRVTGKGGKVRVVEIGAEAVRCARRLMSEHGTIWPHGRRHLHRVWAQDRESLGLADDVTPHVFRHDFASWMVNVEALPLPDVKRILGHADLSTTAIYLHPDGKRVRGAVEGRSESLSGGNRGEATNADSS